MKKQILAFLLAAVMVLSLAACGNNDSSSETTAPTTTAADTTTESDSDETTAPNEEINLRMAWWGSQTRHDITVEVIEMYQDLNPNVKIEYEFYSFDDYFTKLKTMVEWDHFLDFFQLGGNFQMFKDIIF